jgi:hypothetical protein
MQFDNYGSNLFSRSLSGSSFESSLDYQQMSDLMSAYMFGYFIVKLLLHVGVVGGLVYMIRNPYGSNASGSTSSHLKIERRAVTMTEREQRLSKLDQLLTSGLITTLEYERQKQVIEDESSKKTAREAAQQIEVATTPYARYLGALRVLSEAGIISADDFEKERKSLLQRIVE